MNNKENFQKLLLELLASSSVDAKQEKGTELLNLFKKSKLIEYTPKIIRENTLLELQSGINEFIKNENSLTKDNLKILFVFIPKLISN